MATITPNAKDIISRMSNMTVESNSCKLQNLVIIEYDSGFGKREVRKLTQQLVRKTIYKSAYNQRIIDI